jgi:hypothetical protein
LAKNLYLNVGYLYLCLYLYLTSIQKKRMELDTFKFQFSNHPKCSILVENEQSWTRPPNQKATAKFANTGHDTFKALGGGSGLRAPYYGLLIIPPPPHGEVNEGGKLSTVSGKI